MPLLQVVARGVVGGLFLVFKEVSMGCRASHYCVPLTGYRNAMSHLLYLKSNLEQSRKSVKINFRILDFAEL